MIKARWMGWMDVRNNRDICKPFVYNGKKFVWIALVMKLRARFEAMAIGKWSQKWWRDEDRNDLEWGCIRSGL